MPEIALDLIDDNPFRHRDLNPIDPAQIEKLKASIGKNKFWASVVARACGARYQLAFGHTRIEAARALGMEAVPIEVRDLSDLQMVRMLADENGIQRDAGIAPCLDAVAGISEFMAYALMVSVTEQEFSRNWENLPVKYAEARGRLTSGSGIGQPCISAITTSYNKHQVGEALAILKASGRMTAIVATAKAKADAIITDARLRGNNEKALASVTEKHPAIFDDRCVHLFRLDAHAEVFRKFATGETVRSYLPVNQQAAFAEAVMEHIRSSNEEAEITGDLIYGACWERMQSALGIPKHALRDAVDRPSLHRIKEGLNRIRRARGDFNKGLELLREGFGEGDSLDAEQQKNLAVWLAEMADGIQQLTKSRKPKLRIVGGKRS